MITILSCVCPVSISALARMITRPRPVRYASRTPLTPYIYPPAVSYTHLVISGTGNLKLISNPEIKFPDDFEVYDPKVDNQVRLTKEGGIGERRLALLSSGNVVL